MKREDKNRLTEQKIVESALVEFAEKGYSDTSVNDICARGELSKGIVYHYFADKDALYLTCVQRCFAGMAEAVRPFSAQECTSVREGLRQYFGLRELYFAAHPHCHRLFCSATSNPPAHLCGQVLEARSALDETSLNTLTLLLQKAKLRRGMTVSMLAEEFGVYQDYFHVRSRGLPPEEREKKCWFSLDLLLYGMIEREEDEHEG